MRRLAQFAWITAGLLAASLGMATEPVVGGPCDGCETVFQGLPDRLESTSRIAGPEEPGDPLLIEGTVRSQGGRPVEGVIVYAYQTNAKGVYPSSDTRHGALRGWARTDASGGYRFATIRPGAYPGRDIPQHIHLHVIEPGHATYYIDDILFSDDVLLTAERQQQMQRGRGGEGVCTPAKGADGSWSVRRDIVLGSNIPGYTPLAE